MTLSLIECAGDHFTMGRQYGEARASSLAAALDDFFEILRLFPQQASRPNATRAALRLLDSAQDFDPLGVDFIRGQAKGADLPFEEVFALHCLLEVLFNYANLTGLPGMCTSLALGGQAAKDGRTIAGQNIDWFVNSSVDVLRLRHEDGLTSLAVCLGGTPYYHLTSAGLGNCANLTVGPLATGPQAPLGIYLPRAMREPTLERAMAVLQSAAQGLGYYHLADRHGTLLGIESMTGGHVLMRPLDGVLVHANHYEAEEYRPLDRSLQYLPDSPMRAARLRELISARHGSITVEDVMNMLRDHEHGPCSICRHPIPGVPPALASDSRASIIMLPAEGVMWISYGPPCANEYVEFRL